MELGPLRAGGWTHVAVAWAFPRRRLPPPDAVRIYVDGRVPPGTEPLPHLTPDGEEGAPFETTPRWTTHSLQASAGSGGPLWVKNTLRIGGEPSKLFDLPGEAGLFPGNYSADATFDEVYLWLNRGPQVTGGLWGLRELWRRGRYYVPDDADPADARYVSAPLDLRRAAPRSLSGAEAPAEAPVPRLLAAAWTERPGAVDASGPLLRDHSSQPPAELRPEPGADANGHSEATALDLSVLAGGAEYGPFRNPGGSPVRDSRGAPPEVREVRFAAKFKRGAGGSRAAILLESPALDDVTLFFDAGAPPVAGWVSVPEGP
jgi:hypothetical protein